MAWNKISRFIVLFISTGCFVGYASLAPASAACLVVSLGIYFAGGSVFFAQNYALISLAILVPGFLVCTEAERIFKKKDPKQIVIDDILGQFIAVYGFHDSGVPLYIILGFLFFRIIDNVKPFPIRRIERLDGASGIIGDDVAAGLYANLLLRLCVLVI